MSSPGGGPFGTIWSHKLGLRSPRPNNKQAGNTDPLINKQVPKVLHITPTDKGPPPRGTRLSSTYQWAGTCPSHQEAGHKLLYFTYKEADTRSKTGYTPLTYKKEIMQKAYKMRRQRNMNQMKEQDNPHTHLHAK